MKKVLVLTLLLAASVTFAQEKKAPLPPGVYAHFQTSLGDFTCELYEKQSPLAVSNFIGLTQGTKTYTDPRTNKKVTGKPYYDNTVFHRIIDDFMIQGG